MLLAGNRLVRPPRVRDYFGPPDDNVLNPANSDHPRSTSRRQSTSTVATRWMATAPDVAGRCPASLPLSAPLRSRENWRRQRDTGRSDAAGHGAAVVSRGRWQFHHRHACCWATAAAASEREPSFSLVYYRPFPPRAAVNSQRPNAWSSSVYYYVCPQDAKKLAEICFERTRM